MEHLARHGIPVPAPQADAAARSCTRLAGKPAAVVTRLPGSHRLAPDAAHCAQVGRMLARAHLAGPTSPSAAAPARPGLVGRTVPVVLPHLAADQASLLRDELAFQQQLAASPAGAGAAAGHIHADLFRDNVMFDETAGDDRLCGFFDFYFAGVDVLLFDVAVCLNDWCCDLDSGRLDEVRAPRLRAAYEEVRPLTAANCA
jgi:homoserine kinase type II